MLQIETSIVNKTGLHARPASMLVKESVRFKSNIELEFNDRVVNAKSIMGVMSLGLAKGDTVTLHISGEDENDAKDAILALFESGFGEI